MSAENSINQGNVSDRFWNFMGTEDPIHNTPPYALASIMLGFGIGFGTNQVLEHSSLFDTNHQYESQTHTINDLKSTQQSIDKTEVVLGRTANPVTLKQLEAASKTYGDQIKSATQALPDSYHPAVEGWVTQGGSFAIGLATCIAGIRYSAKKVRQSRSKRA